MKVLVIAAHPDDEVLGVGGTIKKMTKNNHDVKILIMSTGIFARRSKNFKNKTSYTMDVNSDKLVKEQLLELRKHAVNASKIMGVSKIEFLDFPDNEMDKISNLEVTKKIEEVISNFKPSIVYTHSMFDLNIDHRIIANATLTATRPTSDNQVKEVYSYEVPSSTEWNFPSKFSPNVFVSIEKELSVKIKALNSYKNEIRSFPHPRSAKGIEIIAKRWGTVSGLKAAEAFDLVRLVQK